MPGPCSFTSRRFLHSHCHNLLQNGDSLRVLQEHISNQKPNTQRQQKSLTTFLMTKSLLRMILPRESCSQGHKAANIPREPPAVLDMISCLVSLVVYIPICLAPHLRMHPCKIKKCFKSAKIKTPSVKCCQVSNKET